MKQLELTWEDLTPEAQEKLLAFYGVADVDETGFDVFPVAIIEMEEEEAE